MSDTVYILGCVAPFQVGQFILTNTLKKTYHLHFFIYQAFKGREGIFFQINLAEWFKIGHKQKYEWSLN